MLTDNPSSNPKAFFFNKPVLVPKKGSLKENKNKSQIAISSSSGDLYPSNMQSLTQNNKKSFKKHFARYFQENLVSIID
jgi:hypothetical protein